MLDHNKEPFFPSFAASPNHSPSRTLPHHSLMPLQESVTKITIELPESMVETTLDENSCFDSLCKEDEGQNIRVFCRFRPAIRPANIKYDHTMVDDG
jgi:hypothetical protein